MLEQCHLGWVVLLTIVTVTAALIIRAVADDRAAHEVAQANAQASAAIPARIGTTWCGLSSSATK